MKAFRFLLVLILASIALYTARVVAVHGFNLFPVFGFGGTGVALGLLAFVGGALFLSTYLLVESFRVRGDVRALLRGHRPP